MTEIEFGFTELFDYVKVLLQYLAGKNGKTSEEYFRFTVCDADLPLFTELLEESLLWLSLCVRRFWGGSAVNANLITICLNVNSVKKEQLPSTEELGRILRDILAFRIIYLWMRIAGWSDFSFWDDKALGLMSEFRRLLTVSHGLRPRRSFPFGNF